MSNYKYFNNRHHEAFYIEVWQLFEVLQKMIGVDYGSDESNIYIDLNFKNKLGLLFDLKL